VSHRFLAPAMPTYFPTLQNPGKPLSDVLSNYYVFLDSAIERILRLADNKTILVVCSAYGIQPSASVQGASGSHEGGSPGVLMVWAPRLDQPTGTLTVSALDIAPTALAALGFPVPADSEGRVVTEALPQGLLEQFPVKPERPRGRRETPAPAVDRAAMDALVGARMAKLGAAPAN
jgi:arylsulfatase A-like enzyme